MSNVLFCCVSMAKIASKHLFSHTLVNSCFSWNSQPCRSHHSVTTWEGNLSRRAMWFVIAILVLLIPLHVLPMVLMSPFPQNVSFHPSPCAQSQRCSMAEVGLLEKTSMYKDLDPEKADILQMQRNHTTFQHAQVSSAEQILRGTLPAVRRKKARSEHASPPSSWDKADRLIVEFPKDMASSWVPFHSPNSTTIKEIP